LGIGAQAPVLDAAGGSLSYTENQAPTAIDTVLTASDADSTDLVSATVSISGNFAPDEDVLGFIDQNGITGIYDSATGVLSLSGASSVANYQAALRSVTYFNSSDNPSTATRAISYQVDEGAAANHASNVVTATVAVTAVNDAPVLDAADGSLSFTENQAPTAIDTVLTASDADSTDLVSATVSISDFAADQDVLGFTNQNGITGSYNSDTGVLNLSGVSSVANYQAALRSVTYFNSSDNPSTASRTISYQVDDGAAENHASNVVTATVGLTAVCAEKKSAVGWHHAGGLAGRDTDERRGPEAITLHGPERAYAQEEAANARTAGNGQRALDGGDSNHTFVGGVGPDWLLADHYNDTLIGRPASDFFAFRPQLGNDVTTNFDPTRDSIQFNSALLSNYAAAMGTEKFNGHGTITTAGTNPPVTLEDVDLSKLSADIFHFV
jgi:hypothetical protein